MKDKVQLIGLIDGLNARCEVKQKYLGKHIFWSEQMDL